MERAEEGLACRKRMIAAFAIAVLLFILGYVLNWILFERDAPPIEQNATIDSPAAPPPKAVESIHQNAANRITVFSVSGSVQRRKHGSPWVQLKRGDELLKDEAIRSEEEGSAVLDIGQTAKVEIYPQSQSGGKGKRRSGRDGKG
jgi:hypothetical protein